MGGTETANSGLTGKSKPPLPPKPIIVPHHGVHRAGTRNIIEHLPKTLNDKMPVEKSEDIKTKETNESIITKSRLMKDSTFEDKNAESSLSSQTKDKSGQTVTSGTSVMSSSVLSERSNIKKPATRGRLRRSSRQSIENGESGDEACCMRIGGMIRNKAFDLVPQTKLLSSAKPKLETKSKVRRHRGSQEFQKSGSVGDDLSIDGSHGVRFVDDDETESSTDYRDIDENSVFLLEFACHSDAQTISRGESCMDYSESGYYTSDVTTKDDDNIPEEVISDKEKFKESQIVETSETKNVDTCLTKNEKDVFDFQKTSENSESDALKIVSKENGTDVEVESQKTDVSLDETSKEMSHSDATEDAILIEDKKKIKKVPNQIKKRIKSPPRPPPPPPPPPPPQKCEDISQQVILDHESVCKNEIKSVEDEQTVNLKEKVSDSIQNEDIVLPKEVESKPKKRVVSPPRPPPPKLTEVEKLEEVTKTETKSEYINPFEEETKTEDVAKLELDIIENEAKPELNIIENETKLEQVNIKEIELKSETVNEDKNITDACKLKQQSFPTKKIYTFPRKYPPPIPVKPFAKKEQKENDVEYDKENIEKSDTSNKEKEVSKLSSVSPKTFPRSGKRSPMRITPLKKIESESAMKSPEKSILTTVVKNSYLEGLQSLPSQKSPKLKRNIPSRPPPPLPRIQHGDATNSLGDSEENKIITEDKQEFPIEDEIVSSALKCNTNNVNLDESLPVEQDLSETIEKTTAPLDSVENDDDKKVALNSECIDHQLDDTHCFTWPVAAERKKKKLKSPPRPPPPSELHKTPIVTSETKINEKVTEISTLDSRGRKRVKSPPRPPLPCTRLPKDDKINGMKNKDQTTKSPPRPPLPDQKTLKKTDDYSSKERVSGEETGGKRVVSPPRPPPPIYEKLPKQKTKSDVISDDAQEKPSVESRKSVASPQRPPPPIYEKIITKIEDKDSSDKNIPEPLDKVTEEEGKIEKLSSLPETSVSENSTTTKKRVTSPPRPPPPIYEKLHPKKDEALTHISEKVLEQKLEQSLESSVPVSPTSSIAMHEYEEIKSPPIFDEQPSKNLSTLPPKAPPRVKRNRSRTVEIVSLTEKPQRRKRRSHSLSDSDVSKKLEDRDLLSVSPPLKDIKTLYTTVQKERGKMTFQEPDVSEEGRASPSYDKMKFRPLPPPPPPPRSRSRLSTSHSPASLRRSSITDDTKPEVKQQDIDSEIRKETAGEDTEDKLVNCDEIANISTSSYYTVTEQESDKNEDVDILENINTVEGSGESKCAFFIEKSKPKTERRKSQSPIRSKSSSPTKQKSGTSSWYDESDVSGDLGDVDTSVSSQKESMEGINNCEETKDSSNSPTNKQKQGKTKAETSKKNSRSSKFYCDINVTTAGEPQDEKEVTESERPVSSASFVEKSIQTSPERELSSVKDEHSDDTDDLLDRARTVQMELCLMLERRKRRKAQSTDDTKSSCSYSPSPKALPRHKIKPLVDASSDHSPQPQSTEFRLPISSARSSNSELSWQGSSSEESEDEKADHLPSFLQTKKQKKAFFIAREIMTSEEVFLSCLKLLNEDYRACIKKANEERGGTIISEEMINCFLGYFPQLQTLNQNLLNDLKDRIEHWEETGKIADVIVKIGPFLKLYSSYIRDFDSLEAAFDDARRKYPLFDQITKEFEMSSHCKKLALKHYMLKPIQRIPQYRLLLQEYLQNLTEDSPDYADTVNALQIVSEVANHANETLKLGDNFQKLVSIQNSILGSYEIVRPGRIFLKEGELMKLSRKEMQPRWFILFNDSLFYLICMQQGLYKVNYELPLTGMKVSIPQHQDYKNEFSIISVTRSFTLAARSLEERQEWVDALNKAIEENASKRSTFTTAMLQKDKGEKSDNAFVLGKQAPVWIPDARVTMCQLCTREFTVTFRRHHCRACGKVVCSLCSGNKAPLQYRNFQVAKVCDECFQVLQKEYEAVEPTEKTSEVGESGTSSELGETDSDSSHAFASIKAQFKGNVKAAGKKIKRHLPSVLKEVCANDQGSTISGYLRKRERRNWKPYWFVLKDKVLYRYKACEDVAALESIPLLGFQVETFTQSYENIEAELLFQLTHAGQLPIIFYTDSPTSTER
ncbi:titin-like isoform X3 [Centruroides sculpturatus]|uniref:titin-like isoform X3 n=2 Tax=Centruroides sculpturatus TaxID=218467 RepID=UPI000C6DFCCA|nr:titin-like isoform X3 [Centruroides sculpturatus]